MNKDPHRHSRPDRLGYGLILGTAAAIAVAGCTTGGNGKATTATPEPARPLCGGNPKSDGLDYGYMFSGIRFDDALGRDGNAEEEITWAEFGVWANSEIAHESPAANFFDVEVHMSGDDSPAATAREAKVFAQHADDILARNGHTAKTVPPSDGPAFSSIPSATIVIFPYTASQTCNGVSA